MDKYIITVPVATDIDASDLLEFALDVGAKLEDEFGADVDQDDDATCVESVK